jgi:protocatechuate 3,4-dioxygenase beta subunit
VPMLARTIWIAFAAACLLAGAAFAGGSATEHEPVVGGPCEGCEAVFQGLPEDLSSVARIAPRDEPGEPMRIEGRVTRADGAPAAGVIVYAYHTDIHGVYPRDERLRGQAAYRHGTLRGWARTDDEGRYRFDTVRPGAYPDSDTPQHVHMHVIEPGLCTYYIDSIVFDDDPRLTADMRSQYDSGRGGPGLVTPRRDEDGTWRVERDIVLGEGIPGYPGAEDPR